MKRKTARPDGATQRAMMRRVARRSKCKGTLELPAVPSLVDEFVRQIHAIFKALGRPFDEEQVAKMRAMLAEKIEWAYERSHNAWVVVEWSTDPSPSMAISYTMTGWHKTVAERYAEWIKERKPPLFGTRPDARLVDLARSLGPPAEVSILDVGAGTGRNALALARAGHPVDALELAPALAEKLVELANEGDVELNVLLGDFFSPTLALPRTSYRIVLLAETCSHWRGVADLRGVFERLAALLEPGGVGLFNVFLARDGFEPDAATREFSQIAWSPVFTRAEVAKAREGLPLELVSDDSVYDYERAHLPADAWPPTGWFEAWTRGRDVFDLPGGKCPSELRWLAHRRT